MNTSLSIFISFLKKEYREWIKTSRFFAFAVVLLFVALSSPLLAKILPDLIGSLTPGGIKIVVPDPTWKDALQQFMKNYSQFVLLVTMIVGAALFSDERAKKTIDLLLVRPLSRQKIILGKFIVAALFGITGTGIAIILFALYTATLFEPLAIMSLFHLWWLLSIQIMLILSLCLLCSVLFTTTFTAFGMSFFMYFVTFPLLSMSSRISTYLPDLILSKYNDLFTPDIHTNFAYSAIIGLLLTGLFLVSAGELFKRQE